MKHHLLHGGFKIDLRLQPLDPIPFYPSLLISIAVTYLICYMTDLLWFYLFLLMRLEDPQGQTYIFHFCLLMVPGKLSSKYLFTILINYFLNLLNGILLSNSISRNLLCDTLIHVYKTI